MPRPWDSTSFKDKTVTQGVTVAHLLRLRIALENLEVHLGAYGDCHTKKEFKRLDKAVVLMKAGLKTAKKAMTKKVVTEVVA